MEFPGAGGEGTLITSPGAIRIWLMPTNCWSPVAPHGCAAPSGTLWELQGGDLCSSASPCISSSDSLPKQSLSRGFLFYFGVTDVQADNIFLFSSPGSQEMKQLFGRVGIREGWQDKESWHCFGNNFIVTLQSCLSPVETPQSFYLCCQKWTQLGLYFIYLHSKLVLWFWCSRDGPSMSHPGNNSWCIK